MIHATLHESSRRPFRPSLLGHAGLLPAALAGLLVASLVGLAGCGGSGTDPSGTGGAASGGLSIVSATPADGAAGVVTSAQVRVRFDRSIDAATVDAQTFRVHTSAPVAGTRAVQGDTIVFTPVGALDLDATHSVEIASGLRATDGGSLAGATAWTFTTASGAWGMIESLPSTATLTGLSGDRELLVAARLESASPWSNLAVVARDASGWGMDEVLFGDGSVVYADVVADADGWAVALANRLSSGSSYSTWARERAGPGAAWGAPVEVAPLDAGFTQPRLALLETGRAIAVYRRNVDGVVQARTLSAGVPWSSAVRISNAGADADLAALASDRAGSAWAIWRENDTALWSARYSAGVWGPPLLVHDAQVCCVAQPAIAMAADGHALAAWVSGGSVLATRYHPAQGVWEPVIAVDGAGCSSAPTTPTVAITELGEALVAWGCSGNVLANRVDSSNNFGSPVTLDASGAAVTAKLASAIDRNGTVTLLWSGADAAGGPRRVRCRRAHAGAAWGAIVDAFTSPVLCGVAPQTVLASDGSLDAAWTITVNCDASQGSGTQSARFE